MKNEKIFIGNLSFNATEDDVKALLSESGTVVSMRFSRKKGHAVAEMSDQSESESVIKNLNGRVFMERALRVNFELPPRKAKSESVKRYNEKGKTLSEEKSESAAKSRRRDDEPKKAARSGERRSGGRTPERESAKSRDGYRGAPKGNRRDDDDSRGNRKYPDDRNTSSDRETSGGYYSQSFRKRVEKAAHAFSRFKINDKFSGHTDDFMKDEQGRDYRDMEKESGRRKPGTRRPSQAGAGRNRQDSDTVHGFSRRDSAGGNRRDTGDRTAGDSGSRPRRTSYADSENRSGGSRNDSRRTTGRPRSSEERTGSSGTRGNSHGGRGGSSSRGTSKSRPADRSRNKQR